MVERLPERCVATVLAIVIAVGDEVAGVVVLIGVSGLQVVRLSAGNFVHPGSMAPTPPDGQLVRDSLTRHSREVNYFESQGDFMNIARLAVRSIIGGLFVGHGTQKLRGWFGGPGLEGTDAMMQALNMHPPRRNALAAGLSETAGGALLVAGLATPLASASLIGTMITAIRKVHLPNGPWAANGGYEYNLVLIAALLALAEEGPGDISLDAAMGRERIGIGWGLAALALGAAASTAAIEMGRRSAPPTTANEETAVPETAGDPVTADE